MEIKQAKRNENTYTLEIEESHDALESAMDKAFVKVSKKARIQGFRPGKAPRHIFERHYGKEMIIQEALIDTVNDAYRAAIDELSLEVIDQPKNVDISEYKENEPVKFKLDVDVKPEVKLGKYKGLKVEKLDSTVTDELIQEQIDGLRNNHSDYKPADKAAASDDIVRADVSATIDGETYEQWTRQNLGFKVGIGHFGDDFDNQVVGLKAEEEKSFSIDYAEDFSNADIAGKTVAFEVKIVEISAKTMPELNDEFVLKATNNEIDTVENLKTRVREELEKQKKEESESKLHNDLVEAACEGAEVAIQPVLVERQIDENLRHLEQDLQRSGLNLDRYIAMLGKSLEDVRESYREDAEKQVKAELVVDAIKDAEKIESGIEDLEAEVRRMNLPNVQSDEEVKAYTAKLSLEQLRPALDRRKTLDFLVENAKIK